MIDGLPNQSFDATSYNNLSAQCDPYYAQSSSSNGSSWCSQTLNNSDDYLEIEFLQSKQIESVKIYGRVSTSQYVTSYQLQYSTDGVNFTHAFNQNNSILFKGNVNDSSGSTTILKETIIAIRIRIIPIEYSGWKSLKFEAFGYEHPCQYIYGGNWLLMKHSYNEWHEIADGGNAYGAYDNNPNSINTWGLTHAHADNSEIFMFSNGDCSQWLVTTHDQFNQLAGADFTNTTKHIIASHFDVNYYAKWNYRTPNTSYGMASVYWSDPWISWKDWDSDDYQTILFACNVRNEPNSMYNPPFAANGSFNVWMS